MRMATPRMLILAFGMLVAALILISSVRLTRPATQRSSAVSSTLRTRSTMADLGPDISKLYRILGDVDRSLDIFFHSSPVKIKNGRVPRHRAIAPLPLSGTNDTIFVAFAAYRDRYCNETIHSLFDGAASPDRVHVGVVELCRQDEQFTCIPLAWSECQIKDHCFSDNVRTRRVDADRWGRGPAVGRYISSLLFRGEAYYLQIDYHLRFAHRWDSDLIASHLRLSRTVRNPVITHRPAQHSGPSANATLLGFGGGSTSHQCVARYVDNGIVVVGSVVVDGAVEPLLEPFADMSFLFSRSAILRDVPLDPHLPYLADGEDVLYSARLWTHGYDMFAPPQAVSYHRYVSSDEPDVFDDHKSVWRTTQQHSIERLHYILESKKPMSVENIVDDTTVDAHVVVEADKYGLGDVRSIDAYWSFCGVDTWSRRIVVADTCRNASRMSSSPT